MRKYRGKYPNRIKTVSAGLLIGDEGDIWEMTITLNNGESINFRRKEAMFFFGSRMPEPGDEMDMSQVAAAKTEVLRAQVCHRVAVMSRDGEAA